MGEFLMSMKRIEHDVIVLFVWLKMILAHFQSQSQESPKKTFENHFLGAK